MPPPLTIAVAQRRRPHDLAETLAAARDQARSLPADAIEIVIALEPEEPAPDAAIIAAGTPAPRLARAARAGVGALRAAALAAATGECFIAWDAGDVPTGEALATLLPALRGDPRAVLVYPLVDPAGGGFTPAGIEPDHPTRLRATTPAAVLLRTAAARAAGGFATMLTAAADLDLWLRLGEHGRYRAIVVPAPLVRPARPTRDEAGALAADLAHLERLDARRRARERMMTRVAACRAGATIVPFDAATWQPASGRRELIWHTELRRTKAAGLVGRRLLAAVARQGITPLVTAFSGEVPADLARFAAEPARWDRFALLADPLVPSEALRVERLIRLASWATTEIPRAEVEEINRHVTLLGVPARRQREDARAAGVVVPVIVLPRGVDADEFPLLARPWREVWTVGWLGDLSPRSGIDLLLRAFRAAFRPKEPVRLLLHGTEREPGENLPAWARADPRIDYRGGWLDHDGLLALLAEIDLFVLPARGGDVGLRGLEAMATGLPVVATAWGGPADYLDPADSLPLGYRLVEAGGAEVDEVRRFGRWAEPDVTHLAELLRWGAAHRETAAAMGSAAAARVRAGWSWDETARRLRDTLDAHASGLSPAG